MGNANEKEIVLMIDTLISLGIMGILVFIAIKAEVINNMTHLIYEKMQ